MLRNLPHRAFRQLVRARPTTSLSYPRCIPSPLGFRYSSTSPDEWVPQQVIRYVEGSAQEYAHHSHHWEDPTLDCKYVMLRVVPPVRRGQPIGSGEAASFGQAFLRENCQCPLCLDPQTRQRKYMVLDNNPSKLRVMKIAEHFTYLRVVFNDGHTGVYPYIWLRYHCNWRGEYTQPLMRIRRYKRPLEPPSVSYQDVMAGDKGLLEWLSLIHEYGFCLVEGVPVTPEATKALVERVAFIRETHYGGFWDFTADMTFKDSAYGSEALAPHTDNTYFTDPARLQLFHLLSHTDGDGGESVLVDGFAAANALQGQPEPAEKRTPLIEALTQIRQPWHSSGNEDVCIQPIMQYPVFNTIPGDHRLYQIRWNEYDRAPKQDWDVDTQQRWYKAAQQFNSITKSEKFQTHLQLKPGTALMFDNWRMLHGRESFTGKRRMCGAYVNNDDFLSRFRLLKYGRKSVMGNLGTISRMKKNPNSAI